jgi:hypothetical protein
MKKNFITIALLCFAINSFAQQQDTTYYNQDSNVYLPQYPVAYWLNDSVLVNPTDSVAYLDSLPVNQNNQHIDNKPSPADTGGIATNGRTISKIFDSLTTGLIPGRIPYGVLYDRVYGWTNLQIPNDTVFDNYTLYQSWLDMESSRVNAQDSGKYSEMRSLSGTEIRNNRFPLIQINYAFSYFDSNAVHDGRLSILNGKLTDNGQGQPPYKTGQATILGFATGSIAQYDTVLFEYIPNLQLTNIQDTLLSVKLTDSIERINHTFSTYGPVTLSFSAPGVHTWVITATWSSGLVSTLYQRIAILPAPRLTAACVPVHALVYSNIYFQGYDESDATNSVADYHIYYHQDQYGSCTNFLSKPIIICDGYDPLDQRDYTQIYNLLGYTTAGGSPVLLGDQLTALGYDIIIVNFPDLGAVIKHTPSLTIPQTVTTSTGLTVNRNGRDGGADYIERNAYIMERLIQIVDSSLTAVGSTDSLVIIGPSMGGQITRYALADMERRDASGTPNMKHRCRLWLSFDSPHLGANIPISVSQNLHFFGIEGGLTAAADVYNSNIRSKAARQLLIEQMDGQFNSATFRTIYTNALLTNGLSGSNGWPKYLRKIALVNGSGAGVANGYPEDKFLDCHAYDNVYGISIRALTLTDYFMPPHGTEWQTSYNGLGSHSWSLFGTSLVYGWAVEGNNITNTNTDGSMDVVPGCRYYTADTIQTSFYSAIHAKGSSYSQTWDANLHYNSFIPTVSSLAFKNPNFDWNTPVNDRNLICTNEIPFDNYYVQDSNQIHITLTADNVAWLMQELTKGEPNCPMACPDAWPNYLCNHDTYSLSFLSVPTGATISWASVDPSITILSASGNPGSIKATRGYSYLDTATTVIATISNSCGADNKYPKKFTVDVNGVGISGPTSSCELVSEYYISDIPPDADCTIGYIGPDGVTHWGTSVGTGTGVTLHGGADGGVWFGGPSSGVYQLIMGCSATCGEFYGDINVVCHPRSYCTEEHREGENNNSSSITSETNITVTPNPANTTWTLSWPEGDNEPLHITLVDVNGNKIFEDKIAKDLNKYTLTCESLSPGVYFAKVVFTKGNTSTLKLMKLN